MNYKILFIMTRSPRYIEFIDQPRPDHFWETTKGSWVGIWGYDWGDLLGKAVVLHHKNIEFEVWQVDERADKIYSATLSNRMVHKQFPARNKKYFRGLKMDTESFSEAMIEHAGSYNQVNTVLLIPSTVITPFRTRLIESLPLAKKIYYNALNTRTLLPSMELSLNPFRLTHRWLLRRLCINNLSGMTNLMTPEDDPKLLEKVTKLNPDLNLFTFRMAALDLDYWQEIISKKDARKVMNINDDPFVMVLSQRLVPEYQIDKFIEVISRVRTRRDFICFITGHGLPDYENYLKGLVRKYMLEDKIQFIGYIPDEALRYYLIACDAFITVPTMFAGSAGAIKAMAIERPVIHVTSGLTYKFLKEFNAGIYLDPLNYDQWLNTFQEVIDGKQINIVSKSDVHSYFSLEGTAKDFKYIIENAK